MFGNNDIVSVKKYNKYYIGMVVGVSTIGMIIEYLSNNKPTQNQYKCGVVKEDHLTKIDFVGMSIEDVRAVLKKSNYWHGRIVKEDGVGYMLTMDFRLDRYNFEVEKGVIVKYDIG